MVEKKIILILLIINTIGGFEISRSVDRTAITLGEHLHLKVKALKQKGQRLIFPGPDYDFGDFELKDMKSTELQQGDEIVETYEYILTLFKLGAFKIPALRVANANDTADFKVTDPVEILVKRVTVADTSDIVDIYGQENIGYGPAFYLIILAVIVLLALLVYLFDRLIKKKQKKAAQPVIVLPPEVQFEKDLKKLLLARLLEKGEVKAFHLKISEILRRYLGARMAFYALESTTSELIYELRKRSVKSGILKLIESFCDINDPVKFAKWIPKTEISEDLIEIARQIVNKTTQKAKEGTTG